MSGGARHSTTDVLPSGNKTTIHALALAKAEGADSKSGFVADKNGNLYGAATNASRYSYGSVFKVKE